MQGTELSLLSAAGILTVLASLRSLQLTARDTSFAHTGLALIFVAVLLAVAITQVRSQVPHLRGI
ncbi:hypothetical protein GMJLKIPL_5786 [Methylobacterium isbiliense]|jgi:hypothetical protein|uniref:Uncharacterized protein n=1 Tax=Methylobacterium isbiliense TaxID=315478 RepID=A0ABQ4SMR1_9HYPH|nr:hypothetical protein GMJLKIPL_5786 [Methylobacterium isbiliense]